MHQTEEVNAPFLMDELDAAGADAGVIQRSVLGPLGATHPADICTKGPMKLHDQNLEWLQTDLMLMK